MNFILLLCETFSQLRMQDSVPHIHLKFVSSWRWPLCLANNHLAYFVFLCTPDTCSISILLKNFILQPRLYLITITTLHSIFSCLMSWGSTITLVFVLAFFKKVSLVHCNQCTILLVLQFCHHLCSGFHIFKLRVMLLQSLLYKESNLLMTALNILWAWSSIFNFSLLNDCLSPK